MVGWSPPHLVVPSRASFVRISVLRLRASTFTSLSHCHSLTRSHTPPHSFVHLPTHPHTHPFTFSLAQPLTHPHTLHLLVGLPHIRSLIRSRQVLPHNAYSLTPTHTPTYPHTHKQTHTQARTHPPTHTQPELNCAVLHEMLALPACVILARVVATKVTAKVAWTKLKTQPISVVRYHVCVCVFVRA